MHSIFDIQFKPFYIIYFSVYVHFCINIYELSYIQNVQQNVCNYFTRSTVRVVRSERAGVGKSLYVKRQHESLESKIGRSNTDLTVSIPLHEKTISLQTVTQRLLKEIPHPDAITTRIFHIDISHEVSV